MSLQAPLNVTLNSATYTAVTLGATQKCQAFSAKTRGGTDWLLSNIAAGTTYYTVSGSSEIAIDLGRIVPGGTVLFYAKDSTGAATLEVVILK